VHRRGDAARRSPYQARHARDRPRRSRRSPLWLPCHVPVIGARRPRPSPDGGGGGGGSDAAGQAVARLHLRLRQWCNANAAGAVCPPRMGPHRRHQRCQRCLPPPQPPVPPPGRAAATAVAGAAGGSLSPMPVADRRRVLGLTYSRPSSSRGRIATPSGAAPRAPKETKRRLCRVAAAPPVGRQWGGRRVRVHHPRRPRGARVRAAAVARADR